MYIFISQIKKCTSIPEGEVLANFSVKKTQPWNFCMDGVCKVLPHYNITFFRSPWKKMSENNIII